MDRVTALFEEIRAFCQQHANPARVQKYARFFVEGYDAYGLDQKEMEVQRDIWLNEHRAVLGKAGFLALAERLVRSGKYEEASFGLWFTKNFLGELTPLDFAQVGSWLEDGVCNWAHTDMFSQDVVAEFLNRAIVPLEAMSGWRSSPTRWQRRAVPVSLLRVTPGKVSFVDALAFIDPLMLDGEKVVHQGLGWLLREIWKQNPQLVEEFLLRWKDRCARLIVQYATEKMTPEQKARFKRTKL